MKRYYSKASPTVDVPSSSVNEHPQILSKEVNIGVDSPPQASTKGMDIEIDLENLPSDPGLRPDIMSYPPNLIEQIDYRCRLNASVVCLRYLIMQGLAFRGNDESERSLNQGNFIELLKLHVSSLRGQGYDGAIGGSCKRRDMLRENQREKIIEGIANGEIKTGRGLNQEMELKRPGDTRWSSHYGTLINLMHLFSSIIDVLEYVGKNGNDDAQRAEAIDLLEVMNRFEFVAKARLQAMRDDGWEILLTEVSKFCSTHEIIMLDMEDEYVARGRGRRRVEKMTNLHHYRVELFYSVIDMQVLELNQRFDEVNTELLLCMACLDPRDSFSAFDVKKLVRLAKLYPSEFSEVTLYELESQLENFIFDVRLDEKFSELSGIGGLAQKMVSTRKHEVFPLVYLLIKLSLVLPVATATVERAFSAMKFIKSALRNRMGDKLLNDCLISYIEKDVFVNVTNEAIMQRFQNMKNRREML
ncbi:uncharacterized protein LOC131000700 [Salvia miltiorrhiza]|uniref:uncharacterized protein LOC131000700 n=1 Tax=Salvia miltiorrhiza TaxID=226208 RepID=UPI0025AC7CC7|nr:uncharacterized protein LOC131000700 [Salvia miltiorrhiza]